MQRHHVLAALTTCVGVVGESLILWHSLVHTYPFKVLSYPSPRFFEVLANVVAPLAALVFVALAARCSLRWPIVTPALLTVLLPMAFAATVALVTVASHGTTVPAGTHNFDGYTIPQALREFAANALSLSAAGFVLGAIAAAIVALIRPRQVAGG